MATNSENGGRGLDRWLTTAWVTGTALILLAPLVAMQFTDEVNWTLSDFAFAGGLLVGVGLIYELVAWKTSNLAFRAAVCIALAAAVGLVWVNGAVGIIGDEGDDSNLMFAAVLAIAMIGAIFARFQPARMAYAMVAAGVAQVLAGAIAVAAGWGATSAIWPWDITGATAFFAGLWLASAWSFRKAAP